MNTFRVHITHMDLTTEKRDVVSRSPQRARDIVSEQLKKEGAVGARIGKVKLVREDA